MAAAIVLAIFWTSALFAFVWLIDGMINYRRYTTCERQRAEFMLWFVVGPIGPMYFASAGWEARYKLHGSILDRISLPSRKPRA